MKLSKYILLLALACTMPSCMDLDIPPPYECGAG